MRITSVSGCQIIQSYRQEYESFQFPVLALVLCPNIDNGEVVNIINASRWIDRTTGPFVLVVLFWKSRESVETSSNHDSYWLESPTEKFIQGDLESDDLKSLRNGFVDEAIPIADALDIPLSSFPCFILLDNPTSEKFYQLPYAGHEYFQKTIVNLVDYLKQKYPDYSRKVRELSIINDQITKYKLQGGRGPKRTKQSIKIAKNTTSVIKAFEITRNEIKFKTNGEIQWHLLKRLNHLLKNPNEIDVIEPINRDFTAVGIDSKRASYLKSLLLMEAEKQLCYDSLSNLVSQANKIKEELLRIPRPKIGSWVRKQRIQTKLRTTKDRIPIFEIVIDIASKIGKLFF